MFSKSQSRLQWLDRNPGNGVTPLRDASRRARTHHLELERLENRTVLSVTIAASNNNGSGYTGLILTPAEGTHLPTPAVPREALPMSRPSTRRWPSFLANPPVPLPSQPL